MERLELVRGTRAEILEALEARAIDAEQLGRRDKARAYRAALADVQAGDGWVEVHHSAFYVVEG